MYYEDRKWINLALDSVSGVEISGFASHVGFVCVPPSTERFWFEVKLKFISKPYVCVVTTIKCLVLPVALRSESVTKL